MRIARLPAAVLLALLGGIVPLQVLASCAEPPALDDHLEKAGVVFVGTIAGLQDDNRTALVDVEEVWRGGPVPSRVTVYGSAEPDDPTMMTSVDRVYTPAARYLFALTVDDRGRLRDDACTATREWGPELDTVRPAAVESPEPKTDATDNGGVPGPVLAIAIAVLAIGVVSVVAFRARS